MNFQMSLLAIELNAVLNQVDRETAAALEQAVRNALAIAQRGQQCSSAVYHLGYPLGYFESKAGSFSTEPLEVAYALDMPSSESW